MFRYFYIVALVLSLSACTTDEYTEVPDASTADRAQKAALGKQLFHETTLSNPVGQSCASCHDPAAAFSDPLHRPVSPGVNTSLFGSRNAPALGYNVLAPARYYDADNKTYVGGLFWDGRADSLEQQALGPLFNPVEMNNTDAVQLAQKVRQLAYFPQLEALYGPFDSDQKVLKGVAAALAAFERSSAVNSFSSKFDYVQRGLAQFTEAENKGLQLFMGKAKCAQCHVLDEDERTGKILLTDFSYDNLGVGVNPNNPFYQMPSAFNPQGLGYIDTGLGGNLGENGQNGKFKVPTLRNIALTAPYFHNGSMATLPEVIRFYNRRDVQPLVTPEVGSSVNRTELGNLQLTDAEEQQLLQFLLTLTDHYRS